MSLTHTETKTTTTEYSVADIEKYTTKATYPANGFPKPHMRAAHCRRCRELLSDFIRDNRWEMLGTFDGFKIITNGYGEFKRVETTGMLQEVKHIDKTEIFSKMQELVDRKEAAGAS